MSDDFFSDAVPSCSFRGNFPIIWEGRILELAKKQATTYNPDKPGTGEPRFWPDGNPMMQGWITLQTEVRDPENEHDDGRRVMVLDSKNKREAVQKAVKDTGHKIAVDGYLKVEWYGEDPNGKNPDNLPKLYRAWYTPPDPTQRQQSHPGTTVSAAPATVSVEAGNPFPTTPATAPTGQIGADPNVAVLINAGMDPAKVATMTQETRALLAASI